jgi:ABC-type transport system substrate-binding protein
MARSLRDQSVGPGAGQADVVELGPNELRRQVAGARVWSSSPVRLLALVFGPRIADARVREALALAVDRTAIHSVLLQKQGEVSGALLPQWITGYAFLFGAAADVARAAGAGGRIALRRNGPFRWQRTMRPTAASPTASN